MKILVTGGAGFIGSAVIRLLLNESDHEVVNIDKLTYAANLDAIPSAVGSPRYRFEQLDIGDRSSISQLLQACQPDAILHLAAETHVDRSIDGPDPFIRSNLLGTFELLEAALAYFRQLPSGRAENFRFLHISTDEVFGSLGESGFFSETTAYDPRSPYSASKAGSDHLVRAWHHTFGLPILMTNCSNNYGPYQFPEKLIPLVIGKAFKGEELPVYGRGENVRDWLYVEDHARALLTVLERGVVGRSYNVGGHNEQRNIDVVEKICALLDESKPDAQIGQRRSLIRFVKDRPGHDRRYAIDAGRIKEELGWVPNETFESGLRKTVQWYLDRPDWFAKSEASARRGLRGARA